MSDQKSESEIIAEEEEKIRQLKTAVDLTRAMIYQGEITYGEAVKMVQNLRSFAFKLFPDKAETFEIIYSGRFDRIINEKYKSL